MYYSLAQGNFWEGGPKDTQLLKQPFKEYFRLKKIKAIFVNVSFYILKSIIMFEIFIIVIAEIQYEYVL